MAEVKTPEGKFWFAMVWSAFLLCADASVFRSMVQQIRAYGFDSTVGIITQSKATLTRNAKGSSYDLTIGYSYSVNGTPFSGTRYRYVGISSGMDNTAQNVAKDYPAGKRVTVYYNPNSPGDAVLTPGIDAFDLFTLLFLVPFHAVAIFMWLEYQRVRRVRKPLSDVTLSVDGSVIRARIVLMPAFMAALCVAGAAAPCSVFVVAVSVGFYSNEILALVLWGVIVCGTAATYVHKRRRENSDLFDLTLDFGARTVTLPKTFDRSAPLTLPMKDISQVITVPQAPQKKWGFMRPGVALKWIEGKVKREEFVAELSDDVDARAYADWLWGEIKKGKNKQFVFVPA